MLVSRYLALIVGTVFCVIIAPAGSAQSPSPVVSQSTLQNNELAPTAFETKSNDDVSHRLQSDESNVVSEQEDPAAKFERLISALSSNDFRTREEASSELFSLGTSALKPLEDLPQGLSYEARLRVRLIRKQIESQQFENLSRNFLIDRDESNSYGLPGWNAFRSVVGSTRTGKLLFLDTLKSQPEIMQIIDGMASKSYETGPNIDRLRQQRELTRVATEKAQQLLPRVFAMPRPETGESVGLLLAVAYIEGNVPIEVSEAIRNVTRLSFDGMLRQQGYQQCLQQLLAQWIPKTHEAMAPDALRIALDNDISSCIEIARNHISDNFDVTVRELAFHAIAKYGDETDVERMLPYLNEDTVVDEVSDRRAGGIPGMSAAPPGVPVEIPTMQNRLVRVNDLALASCMLLLKEDPTTTFPDFSQNEFQLLFSTSLAVSPEEIPQRELNIKKWREEHFPTTGES